MGNAKIVLSNGFNTTVRQVATAPSGDGSFQFRDLPSGSYVLEVRAKGFQLFRKVVQITVGESADVAVNLGLAEVSSQITVTADRALVASLDEAAQQVAVNERDEFTSRPLATTGHALQGNAGVSVQETTRGQVSPILRGLTGYQTLLMIDGIRFNTSTFRSGPNQYLAFIQPGQVEAVEAVLGPSGAAYGGDSLGGTVNVLSRQSTFAESRELAMHGDFSLEGALADLSGGASGQLSLSTETLDFRAGGFGNMRNDLRTGQAFDSRNVYLRYFGLGPSQVGGILGTRLQDTGYDQAGAHGKFAARLRGDQSVTLWYQRGMLYGVRSYRDLAGGLGRLQSSADPQKLDFFYGRYEKRNFAFLDTWSGVFSVNSQQDGSVRQAARLADVITSDSNRTGSFGYSTQAGGRIGGRSIFLTGADLYIDRVQSTRSETDPATGTRRQVRAQFPDGARYSNLGIFGQMQTQLFSSRLRLSGGGRYSAARFRTFAGRAAGGSFGVPDSNQRFRNFTFHGSASLRIAGGFSWHALVSSGFRAPNVSDLGAVGLTGLGYEVSNHDAILVGGLMGNDASEAAVPSALGARRLIPETLLDFETGIGFRTGRLVARVQAFHFGFRNPISRRSVLFPAHAAPGAIGGTAVSPVAQTAAQRALGVVLVSAAGDPRGVKSFFNDGSSVYYGVDSTVRYRISNAWQASGNYSYLVGRDLNPNRHIRRLPPQQGQASVRYAPARFWLEAVAALAGGQSRLNAADLDDERIGASRRRSDIAAFFASAPVSPFIGDGRFAPTGETLLQIQNRVLPIGSVVNGVAVVNDASRVPLHTASDGWIVAGVRGGFRLSTGWSLLMGIDNMFDRSYRIHGSGVDAPGRSAFGAIRFAF